jgi:hypothetical protein
MAKNHLFRYFVLGRHHFLSFFRRHNVSLESLNHCVTGLRQCSEEWYIEHAHWTCRKLQDRVILFIPIKLYGCEFVTVAGQNDHVGNGV